MGWTYLHHARRQRDQLEHGGITQALVLIHLAPRAQHLQTSVDPQGGPQDDAVEF